MNKKLLIPLWIWKIMRVSLFQLILCAVLCGVSYAHKLSGQAILEKKVTLDVREQTFKKVLHQLERQTDARFVYSSSLIDPNRKVTGKFQNERLEVVLYQLLQPLSIDFSVSDEKMISLRMGMPKMEGRTVVPDQVNEILQRVISGRVTDDKGEGLPGVSILVKGTQRGMITDVEGKFSLEVANDDEILVFSFVGYLTQEVVVGNRANLQVTLAVDQKSLEEVVVIGYGTMEKKDLSSAITKIDGEMIKNQPLVSPAALLIGKVTGMQVVSNSGAPGAGVTVRIRGASSLSSGGNDPLYVVDGVPTGNILGINPNDIESIEVLKDASSSAIYGSRAANGVVLISTKRGKKGQTQMSFDSYYGLQQVYKRMHMMNAQEQWEYIQKGIANYNRLNPSTPVEVRAQVKADYEAGYDTDWQDQVFRVAPVQSYDFSASGGSDRTRFSANLGYFNQEGVVISNGFQRVAGRFTFDFDLTKYLTLGTSLRANYSVTDNIPAGDNQASVMANLQRKMALEPVYEPNGLYSNRERPNLVASALEYKGQDYQAAGIGSVYAKLKLLKGLEFNTSWAADFASNSGDSFSPSTILGGATRPSSAFANRGMTWLSENVLSYSLQSDKLNLSAIAGYSAQENQSFNFSATASGGPSDLIETMNASTLRQATSSSKTGWGITSLFGRVNTTYAGKYIASLSLRRDGSSRFGSNNRYAYFPAASVAWRINEEEFLKDFTPISELKLRASVGRTGNQNIGNYVAQGTYVTGANYNGQAGVRVGGIPSANLGWESTNQTDIGLDLGLYNHRINFSADVYRKVTNGLLFSMPLPQYTGFSSYWTNLGEIENKGIEFELEGDIIRGEDFQWSAGANISFNKNTVNKLPNGTPILVTETTEVYYTENATFITQEGKPIGQFYGLNWTGEVYSTDEIAKAHVSSIMGQAPVGGTLKYEDVNGDGKIDANDRTVLGSPLPQFFGGFNTQASWRNFDLSMQFSFVSGNLLFNQMRFLGSRGFAYDAARKERVNAWSGPGDITTEHKVLTSTDARDNQFSSKYLENASYLRLNNLSIGYNLPASVISPLNIKRLRVYFSSQNLFTITKYSGYDPEVNAKPGDIRTQGVDIGMIPQVTSYMLGVNLNF